MLLLTSLASNCGLFLLHVHCIFTIYHQYTKALFYAVVVFMKKGDHKSKRHISKY